MRLIRTTDHWVGTTDWLLEICRFSLVAQFDKYPKSREMWKAMMCKLFLVPSCLRARLRSGRRGGIDRDIRRGLGTRIIHKKHCILMQLLEEVNMAGYYQKKLATLERNQSDFFVANIAYLMCCE